MSARRESVWIGCFKNMGSESVVAPPSLKAHSQGHHVSLLIEGKGGERFLKNHSCKDGSIARMPSDGSLSSEWLLVDDAWLETMIGSDDFEKRPYGFDPKQFFVERSFRADSSVVLVGESRPIYAERLIAHAVMRLRGNNNNLFGKNNPKLICCQDFWNSGVIVAPDVIYDMAQCVDEYAAELTLKTYPHLSERDIVIRGNPGVKEVSVRPEIQERCAELKKTYDTIYFFSGADEPRTSAELKILLQSLLRTSGSLCLVVGWHPKLVEKHGDFWRSIVESFPCHVEEAEPGTGDEWGVTADVVVSGWSTIMTTAAYAGRRVIALDTPESRQMLVLRSMEQIPQVAMGWAELLEKPADLSGRGVISAEARKKLVPFDVDRAYESIAALLE